MEGMEVVLWHACYILGFIVLTFFVRFGTQVVRKILPIVIPRNTLFPPINEIMIPLDNTR
jgi:hypothetical protein